MRPKIISSPPGMTPDRTVIVREYFIKNGDIVKAGDLLAVLDSGEFEMEIESPYNGIVTIYAAVQTDIEPNSILMTID